jgi:serine/threonine protein phosphatase 1
MTTPLYAVGDIHGQLGMLDAALARIEADGGQEANVVFLGDYVDRGADSQRVIHRLIQGLDAGRNWICLKGNHDRYFDWFMETPPRIDPYSLVGMDWFHDRIGGVETLASYGVEVTKQRRIKDVHREALEAVPQSHVDFLRSLHLFHETDDLFLAHAGIRPGIPLDQQTEEDLLWIRQEFHIDVMPHPKLIVHGHTPVDAATHYGNRVNLDSGAGFGHPLSVAVFEGSECHLLTADGRKLLAP